MEDLYHDDLVMLAEGENEPKIDFNSAVFERAAEWIRERGEFNPSMLREMPALDVLRETLRVLQGGIGEAITEQVPDELIAALENNAFVFSGFKTYHSLNEVGASLTKDGKPKSFEEFHKDVEQIDARYNQNYLYAEYNHAIHSSQMAVKWHDFEQDGDRYDLQYRTANDEKVRAEHQRLNGITLPPSDPFWERYLPPNGWNCRCNVVQVRKDKYPRSNSDDAVSTGDEITAEPKQQMFRFNAGKELKIYPDKHPYYKAPKEVKKTVLELAKEEFTAKTIPEATQQFIDKLGVNCDLSGFKKQDIEQVKDIFNCVDRHFKSYPELREKIKFVGSMNGRINFIAEKKYQELRKSNPRMLEESLRKYAKSWARKAAYSKDCYAYSSEGCAQYGANGLVFNSAMAGEKFKKYMDNDLAQKYHPIGCGTVKAVFDHELGHKIDALLSLRSDPEYLAIFNDAKAKGEQYITDNLSHYAYNSGLFRKSNYSPQAEFIAEAWSEYLNNDQPRPIAAAVGALIRKKYNDKK